MTSPLKIYRQHLAANQIEKNPYQLQAVTRLDLIYNQLITRAKQRSSASGKIIRKIKPRSPIKGLYLWGSVGIGKTYILDLFYNATNVPKLRMHYHNFMQYIHDQLKTNQGKQNPLTIIAKGLADKYLVICLDEFLVADIADAMILSELMRGLFRYGACLITTSNTSPNNLYLNGIQREKFLPTITLLNTYTTVIHQQTIKDYRKSNLERAGIYFTPLNNNAKDSMNNYFNTLCSNSPANTKSITVLGRKIKIIRESNKTIWFEFDHICNTPRSQNDYLELSKTYNTFFISNIPAIQPTDYAHIIPFIKLVDILYDDKKQLVISAATTPNDIYPTGKFRPDFERTASRIIEMGSTKYKHE